MDSKSWMNLLKTEFKVGEQKLATAGLDISHEVADAYYYNTFSSMRREDRMVARVTLMAHYSPKRVLIEGDAELVHAILEKLK